MIVVGTLVGIAGNFFVNGYLPGVLAAICRALLVTAGLYLLYMLGMLGAGDVKLCGMAVLFLDFRQGLLFLTMGFLMAGIAAFAKMLLYGNLRERISYFCSYVAEILRTGKVGLYFREELSLVEKQAVLHMAGPLLAGLLVCMCFG